ncbi:MAG: lactate utilization protein [Paludibacter sp.]|nr:lactate utilization protein [Paludibacter sp.]
MKENLIDPAELNYIQEDIYKPVVPDALTCFKQELEAISGQCVLCGNEEDMCAKLATLMQTKGLPVLFSRDATIVDKLRRYHVPVETDESKFNDMPAGVTACEYLVTRTGSAVVTSSGGSGRQMHVFPPVHIILASVDQLVDYLEDALVAVRQKYENDLPSVITVVTGPSRTADIEKTLVLGAHGPKELIIFVQQYRNS